VRCVIVKQNKYDEDYNKRRGKTAAATYTPLITLCSLFAIIFFLFIIYRLSRQNLPQKEQNKGSKRMDE
jgi:heme/copper-type cytochrome/quinol oxidase subunit 3